MKTTVKKLLEIPAGKHLKKSVIKKPGVEKSFSLVINLWIFRYEYSKEQSMSES